jgi:hypothetical protein
MMLIEPHTEGERNTMAETNWAERNTMAETNFTAVTT